MFHDVMPVGDGGGELKVLLDQEYGKAPRLEHSDGLADLLNNDRREPFGRLIQQEQPRSSAQDARNRQHLLFATRQFGALAFQPLAQIGKQREDAVDLESAGAHLRRQEQIFTHVEASEYSALFRAERNAGARDRIRGLPHELPALETHGALALSYDSHDRFERRGLADAVAS